MILVYLGSFLFILVSVIDNKRTQDQRAKEVEELVFPNKLEFPDNTHDELILEQAFELEKQLRLDEKFYK